MHIWVSEYAIEDNWSRSGCVPDQQTATCYHKMRLVHSNEHKVYHSYHPTGQKSTNIMHGILFNSILILKEIYLM